MYDFSDPLVRILVERCHVPFEHVVVSDDGQRVLTLLCEKDHLSWPCPARVDLRQWTQDQYEAAVREGRTTTSPPLDK